MLLNSPVHPDVSEVDLQCQTLKIAIYYTDENYKMPEWKQKQTALISLLTKHNPKETSNKMCAALRESNSSLNPERIYESQIQLQYIIT